jgi:hypothetical protein
MSTGQRAVGVQGLAVFLVLGALALIAEGREASSVATAAQGPPPPLDDVQYPPPFWPQIMTAEEVGSVAYGAGYYDVTEYMIGSVAVALILPESNGALDPSTENWTSPFILMSW